jgi:hypothetical protein
VQTAVAPLPNRALELWAVDTAGGLWTTWKTTSAPNATWSPWVDFLAEVGPLPGGVQHVSVGPLADRRLQLWAVAGHHDSLFTTWKTSRATNAKWSPWSDFFAEAGRLPPGVKMTAATQLGAAHRTLELFAIDQAGGIFTTWQVREPTSKWVPWVDFLAETGGL